MSDINKIKLLECLKKEADICTKEKFNEKKTRFYLGRETALTDIIGKIEAGKFDFLTESEGESRASLITTIESQKEEMENLKQFHEGYSEESIRIESQLRDQIASLKDITELAVKGVVESEEVLRELHSQIGQDIDINPSAKIVYLSKVKYVGQSLLQSTISEIERLSKK